MEVKGETLLSRLCNHKIANKVRNILAVLVYLMSRTNPSAPQNSATAILWSHFKISSVV